MENKKFNKSKPIRKILLGCVVACLVFVLCIFFYNGFHGTDPVEKDPTATESVQENVGISEILKSVVSLKDDLKAVLNDLRNHDLESAAYRIDGISENLSVIRDVVNKTLQVLGGNKSFLGKQVANVQGILDLADIALDRLLKPAIVQLQTHPFSELHVGDGINTKWIGNYLDFAENLMPDVEAFLHLANSVDLSLLDSEGKIAAYLEMANGLLEKYNANKSILSLLKSALGVDEDRLYLLAVQNSAEIRASGGFPGSMGVIRITDGVLVMEDFQRVYNVLKSNTPPEGKVTALENHLFHTGLIAPRDADYCPDFERVAYIWALGYEAAQNEPIDGVISMTPCLVQRLLAAMQKEIELFDGTILTGDNATKILQHDLYFNYFKNGYSSHTNQIVDQLFADAAKKLMHLLMDNMQISQLTGYLSVAQESFADRTLMIWMQDEAAQTLIQQLDWDGGLNTDPENPQAGVYYSCTVPSKMGWFLVMNTEAGERTKNDDGSYTYPVTVTFSNSITDEELKRASNYITGGNGGSIGGSAYFFAPAGGTISGFTTSNDRSIRDAVYADLQLGYMLNFSIKPQQTVTITYNVTTAPGVETPLTFSKTPTVQDYH